jgi:HPt (histidine-containing phosphotransfer) domain-containing protein
MGDLALKQIEFLEFTSERFPFQNLLTKALVESLCPILKSEIVFGTLEQVSEPVAQEFWIEALVRGDLEGRIGMGCDGSTLRGITQSGSAQNESLFILRNGLLSLHETLVQNFEKQFSEESFRCDLRKGTGFRENYQVVPEGPGLFRCPVETPYGLLNVFVSLQPTSKELKSEILERSKIDQTKKIRVFSGQIDSFVEQVQSLEQLERRLLQGPEVRSQLRSQIKKMKRSLYQLRTDSLDTIFPPAQKLVNDLAKNQGKQVNLELTGTWLHLHKTLLNFIYEPVLHLIRNAVDHGIEDPLRREQNGKKAAGRIGILASFNQGILRIIFSDDGAGLDFGAIRERAVAKGIFNIEEANAKPNEELAQLIFQPGFTTRKQTNFVSGRGLGLDVVKKSLDSVGGTVRLVSTSTHGTSFELLIPVNEDFSPVSAPAENALLRKEEEEKTQLLDELTDYQERFIRALQALGSEETLQSAYEAYRIAHLMKGICGFLGWNRVVSYLYPLEEVLKLLSEEKIGLSEYTIQTLQEAAFQLKSFYTASRTQGSFSLNKLRRSESRMLQLIWGSTRNDDKTHLFIGKYHLNAVENFLLPLAKNGSFSVRPEVDFTKGIGMPYGALIQFNGDRRGFAGIYLPESTLKEVIHPFITGSKEKIGNKRALGSLTEFGNLMGNQFAEACAGVGITLQPSAPLTYYGLGEPMKALGIPTYCFQCEINGYSFYLAGDFRLPQEFTEANNKEVVSSSPPYFEVLPQVIEQSLAEYELKATMAQESSQSDLIGFDGGFTSVVSFVSEDKVTPDMVLFLSYESSVVDHLLGATNKMRRRLQQEDLDFFDSLGLVTEQMSRMLRDKLEHRKIRVLPGAPALFMGKAYVANFNRLFVTNKLVGNSEWGRVEAQVLFTELLEDKAN